MTASIKVIFVDDDMRIRAAWEKLIGAQADMELVGALSRADELVGAVKERKVDVALLDLTMPGRDPLDVIAELARDCPQSRVIVYSGHSDRESMQRAFDAGAWGYVDKLDSPQDVLSAVRRIAGGEIAFPRGFSM